MAKFAGSVATYAASYDIWVDELRSGFGILATTDKMGSAGWRTTTVNLNYSYKVRLVKRSCSPRALVLDMVRTD